MNWLAQLLDEIEIENHAGHEVPKGPKGHETGGPFSENVPVMESQKAQKGGELTSGPAFGPFGTSGSACLPEFVPIPTPPPGTWISEGPPEWGGQPAEVTSPLVGWPCDLTPEDQEDWNERAAVLEFDGGLSRAEAECQALIEMEVLPPVVEVDGDYQPSGIGTDDEIYRGMFRRAVGGYRDALAECRRLRFLLSDARDHRDWERDALERAYADFDARYPDEAAGLSLKAAVWLYRHLWSGDARSDDIAVAAAESGIDPARLGKARDALGIRVGDIDADGDAYWGLPRDYRIDDEE